MTVKILSIFVAFLENMNFNKKSGTAFNETFTLVKFVKTKKVYKKWKKCLPKVLKKFGETPLMENKKKR